MIMTALSTSRPGTPALAAVWLGVVALLILGSLPPPTLHAQRVSRDPATTVGPQPAAAFVPSGAVYAWGANNSGQLGNNTNTDSNVPTPVSTVSGFLNRGVGAVSAGQNHSVAL